jgi:hypothetical protein
MPAKTTYRASWAADSVTTVDRGSGDATRVDAGHIEATRREARALRLLSAQANARAQATRTQIREGRSQREVMHDSAYARLQARLGTMAVIEQAKGIIMAQQGCTPEEAFALLRQVSQRVNIKVHVLAAQIVAHVTPPPAQDRGNFTAISLGAVRHARS